MDFLRYAAIVVLAVGGLVMFVFSAASGRPLRRLLLNALIGVGVFAAVDLTTRFTGVHLPLNEWTAAGAAVYGVPGVCGLLLLQIIFQVS